MHETAIRWAGESTLTAYSPNQYPGINWTHSEDKMLSSAETVSVITKTWNAGTSSQSDSEIVVKWSPFLTKCNDNDTACLSVDPNARGISHEPSRFSWRIAVYQLNDWTTCNKDFGAWSSPVECTSRQHHCGANTYARAIPIVTGTGSEGTNCGGAFANRQFKVFAQMKKTNESESDFRVHGDNKRSNLIVYSR